MNEFSLIDHFFKSLPLKRGDVLFGIGDDAACLAVPEGMNLLVSTDTLVSGIHFLPEWDAYDIACKSLLVNLSDMAAMAAEPAWCTLALTLPELNEPWLASFSQGLADTMNQYGVDLVGGDTTRGPLSITITIMGFAPKHKALRRNGAQAGDVLFVSGALGAAALAVTFLKNQDIPSADKAILMQQLLHPKPRVDLIPLLRQFASSAVDISDGLSADLNHICAASAVGACITEANIPLHPLLPTYLADKAVDLALTGGDDYELCFTVPEAQFNAFMDALKKACLTCYPIGVIEDTPGLRIKKADGSCVNLSPKGYAHF